MYHDVSAEPRQSSGVARQAGILRHNGVDAGKQDFFGSVNLVDG
jgi:hypothetical protein